MWQTQSSPPKKDGDHLVFCEHAWIPNTGPIEKLPRKPKATLAGWHVSLMGKD